MNEDRADEIIKLLAAIAGLVLWIAFYVTVYISFCLGPVYRHILARWRRWIEGGEEQPPTCRRKP